MSEAELDFLGEGVTDDAMARQMILAAGGVPGRSRRTPISGAGKSNLDRRLKGINAGLKFGSSPILVLRDLDTDSECAFLLRQTLVSGKHDNMLLRIAVRSSESWLLADSEMYAKYCNLPLSLIPSVCDSIPNPKELIFSWAAERASSKISRHIKESTARGVPRWAAMASWNASFIEHRWDPIRASRNGTSVSLTSAMRSLSGLIKNYRNT